MMALHLRRGLFIAVLLGNTIIFAGVDPLARAITAAAVLATVIDMRRVPPVPLLHRIAMLCLAVVIPLQLVPLPEMVRRLLQPGLSEVMRTGWAPLAVSPWSTVQVAASLAVVLGIALTAARMAATRSGLPTLLVVLAITGALIAVLGIASEGGIPDRVLLIRDNTGQGNPYGSYVNRNHFAQGIELTLPAAVVLLAAASRHVRRPGIARQRAAVQMLAAGAAVALGCAAMLRSGSRGGVVFLAAAGVLSIPYWRRPQSGRRWPAVLIVIAIVATSTTLAATRLPELKEQVNQLLMIEGSEGNNRWDLWAGTCRLWGRCPVLGCGLGGYRFVIGLDKPATGPRPLEQAHNDWLEWGATGGLAGAAILTLGLVGLAIPLRPRQVRRLRSEYRYPMAGAIFAMGATLLHEMVGFGLQTPLNRYLLAAWIGLIWGLLASTSKGPERKDSQPQPQPAAAQG